MRLTINIISYRPFEVSPSGAIPLPWLLMGILNLSLKRHTVSILNSTSVTSCIFSRLKAGGKLHVGKNAGKFLSHLFFIQKNKEI